MEKKDKLIPRNIKVTDQVWREATRLSKLHYQTNTSELIRNLLEKFIESNKNKQVEDRRQGSLV